MKHRLGVLFFIFIFLTASLCGCARGKGDQSAAESDLSAAVSGNASGNISGDASGDASGGASGGPEKPGANAALFNHLIEMLSLGESGGFYEHADAALQAIIGEDELSDMLDYLPRIGGGFQSYEVTGSFAHEGLDVFVARVNYDNISADITVALADEKIMQFYRNVFFNGEFELENTESSVCERYFVLENEGFRLNAVYTTPIGGKDCPVVLFIGGSGPQDYNATTGILTPFADMAAEFAERGIASLRFDKRTWNYGDGFALTDGIEEEYLSDCRAALDYITAQNAGGKIYLLGHSLGGQIASVLAAEENDFGGIILFNSSARHLADIAYDQYRRIDPENVSSYAAYTRAAKAAEEGGAEGLYYYGASDYYWAALNKVDVIENIRGSALPVFILNSTYDKQSFDDDINLWNDAFGEAENAVIYVDDKISHFGYEIDTDDLQALYRKAPFPEEIAEKIADFIIG